MMLTAEAASLRFQHRLFYRELGTLFPHTISPKAIKHVLDLSCGPGAWLLEVMQVYPHIDGIGVDQKPDLIQGAREDAQLIGIDGTAFRVLASYEKLPYPDNSFDFVHVQRSSAAIIPEQWPTVLRELARVLRPGGWIHFLDFEIGPTSSSAINTFIQYIYTAHSKDGRVFSPEIRALTSAIVFPRLLAEAGYTETQYMLHALDIGNQTGSVGREYILSVLAEDSRIATYLVKAGVVEQRDIDRLLATIREDVQRLKYCATGMLISIVGMKPEEDA